MDWLNARFTTSTERILFASKTRNILQLSSKPPKVFWRRIFRCFDLKRIRSSCEGVKEPSSSQCCCSHYLDGQTGQKTQYISSAMDLNAKCCELEKEVLKFIAYKEWGQKPFSVLYVRLPRIRRGGFFGNFSTNPSSDSPKFWVKWRFELSWPKFCLI